MWYPTVLTSQQYRAADEIWSWRTGAKPVSPTDSTSPMASVIRPLLTRSPTSSASEAAWTAHTEHPSAWLSPRSVGDDTKRTAADASTLLAAVSARFDIAVKHDIDEAPVGGCGTGKAYRKCRDGPRWTCIDGCAAGAVDELAAETAAGIAEYMKGLLYTAVSAYSQRTLQGDDIPVASGGLDHCSELDLQYVPSDARNTPTSVMSVALALEHEG